MYPMSSSQRRQVFHRMSSLYLEGHPPPHRAKSVRSVRTIDKHALFTKPSKARPIYSLGTCLQAANGIALFVATRLKGLNHTSVCLAEAQVVPASNWYDNRLHFLLFPCSIFIFLTVSSMPLKSLGPSPSTSPDNYLSGKLNFAQPCQCPGCSTSVVPTVYLQWMPPRNFPVRVGL